MLASILVAGFGGIVPTMAKLASFYVTNPRAPLPENGLYYGLLLFFAIGGVLAAAMKERDLKQAFILGVCAPAVITNIMSGATDHRALPAASGPPATAASAVSIRSIGDVLFPSAYAQSPARSASSVSTGALSISPTSLAHSVRLNILVTQELPRAPTLQVFGLANDGSTVPLLSTSATSGKWDIAVPANVRVVGISSAGHAAHVALPESAAAADITARVGVRKSNDFLWALGADRTSRVAYIETNVEPRK